MQEFYNTLNATDSFISDKLKANIHILKRNLVTEDPKNLYYTYTKLCKHLGIGSPDIDLKPLFPYNLLISPSWMVIVKRLKDHSHGFNLNALAFAGYLLSTTDSDNQWLNLNGPIKLLETVIP